MAYMTENDYLKLANAAAIDLVENKVPLNESVTKLAQQFDLNQDQIMRLCEATNNTAFNHIFKNKTASDDRLVEFEIADPKSILGQQIKEASVSNAVSTSVTDLYELPDQMSQVRTPYTNHFLEKVAASEEAVRVRVVGKGGDLQIFSVGSGLWEMPSGTVTSGESRGDAASRILLKKTGLRTMPSQLKYVGLETFRGKMYHTYEVDPEKLQRAGYPTDEKGNKPRIEYRKQAGFELRPESKPKLEVDLRTLEKTASYIKHEMLAAHMDYNDQLIKLAKCFKRLYKTQTFEDFEKQATKLHAKTAETCLCRVRELLGKPEVTYNWEALQKTASYIDTDTEEFTLLDKAIQCQIKIAAHSKALEVLNTQITALNTEVRAQ